MSQEKCSDATIWKNEDSPREKENWASDLRVQWICPDCHQPSFEFQIRTLDNLETELEATCTHCGLRW